MRFLLAILALAIFASPLSARSTFFFIKSASIPADFSAQSVDLNGSDENITVADHASLDFTTSLTATFWIKTSTGAADSVMLAKYDNGANKRSWQIGLTSAGLVYVNISGDGLFSSQKFQGITQTTDYSDGAWHLVTLTFDGTQSDGPDAVKIYVDASVKTLTVNHNAGFPFDLFSSDMTLTIGSSQTSTSPSAFYDGLIDDVAVFNDVLTQNEITAIYASGTPQNLGSNFGDYASSANLQGFWNFEQADITGAGGVTDVSSNTNNGTVTNMDNTNISTDVP